MKKIFVILGALLTGSIGLVFASDTVSAAPWN